MNVRVIPAWRRVAIAAGFLLSFSALPAGAGVFKVTVENLAPQNGTYLTPVWVGFHDGTFDLFDMGVAAVMPLERLAEDGNAGPLSGVFTGGAQGSVGGAPLAPGDVASAQFTLDENAAANQYFSFAAMVIPSNDAFIGNPDPLVFKIFEDDGSFLGADFFVTGAMIRDAGTEVNDEIPENTPLLMQTVPDTGTPEGGVVHMHMGFNSPNSGGNILSDPRFANADFTRTGYPVAQIRVEAVPLPGAVWLFGSGLMGIVGLRRKLFR
jgi:hypothetical protein